MKIENDKIDEKSSLDRRQFIKKTLFSIPILTSISITSLLTSCEKDTEDLSSGGGGSHLVIIHAAPLVAEIVLRAVVETVLIFVRRHVVIIVRVDVLMRVLPHVVILVLIPD